MNNILFTTLALLKTTPDRWTRLAETIPSDLLTAPPAPGQWSALECLHHLVATETVFNFRLNSFLEREGQRFPAYDPDAPENRYDPSKSAVELAEAFAQQRAASLEQITRLNPTDLKRKAVHGQLGPVTLEEMIHEWAAHDLNHTIQAERALMQPFIAGCGPWQQYFTDHIVK